MVAIRDTNTSTLTGVLAAKHSLAVSGNNLSVVAYHRSVAGVWAAETWPSGVPAAQAWLALHGESVDLTEIDEIEPVGVPILALAEAPIPVVGGVVEGDPVVALVTDPIAGPSFLSLLVNAGYPAADVPTSGEIADAELCGGNPVLDAAKDAFAASSRLAASTFSASMASRCSSWCLPWRIVEISGWSAWQCGAWRPDSTGTQSDAGICRDNCLYERPISRTRQKWVWVTHLDCTYTATIYTQTESGLQNGACFLDLTNVGCVRGILTCPAAPSCDLSYILCTAGPDTGVKRTLWQ